MARGILRGIAHVDHHRVAPIDELHRFQRTDLVAGADQPVDERPDQHAAGNHGRAKQRQMQWTFLQKRQELLQPELLNRASAHGELE
ncbi:hypothetical protein D3C83_102800 [compost metagenome]